MTKKYIVINDPIVDIIAISRAKKRAAQKLNIPFSIGDEIYASDLLNQKEFHTHVDLSNENGYKKQKYYRLMKKYSHEEFEKIAKPHKKTLFVIFCLLVASAAGLFTYCSNIKKSSLKDTPKTIQKALPNKPLSAGQNIRS